MKNIIMVMLALGVLLTVACNQQEDIMGKVKTEVNDRADSMIDSLKRVCNTNFDTALQSRVTAAIKANNQPAVKAKPSIKASSKPKTTAPAKTTTAPPPPPKPISKGGRKGVGKGGGVLKNQNKGAIKTVPVRPDASQTKPTSTGTTTQPSGIKTRPGVKTRPGTKGKSGG